MKQEALVGRRVGRLQVATGGRTLFVCDGDDLLLELDESGNVQAQYTYYRRATPRAN